MIFTSRYWIAILLCTFLVACGEKNDTVSSPDAISSDSVISPEKMILILADVHVVEAALLVDRNAGGLLKDKSGSYYKGIFEKYHISPARYEQNLTFYSRDPENYARMYAKVITVLENRQKQFKSTK
jgi:hypothetical protein